MKHYCYYLLLFLLCFSLQTKADNGQRFNHLHLTPMPALEVNGPQGVSGAFSGTINGKIIVAGGCNFPDRPAAEGGIKHFYDNIYELNGKQWELIGRLKVPTAYGVSIQTSEGLVCIGGTCDGKTSRQDVSLLKTDGGKTQAQPLPPLPIGLDNMAGAYGDGYIYIAGGQSNGNPSQMAFRLKYPSGKQWERLPDMPGTARVQPAAVVQNGNIGPNFYLLGGFDPVTQSVDTTSCYFNPRDYQWHNTAPTIPYGQRQTRAIVGAVAVPSGCSHILVIGGVNKEIFEKAIRTPEEGYLSHPKEWYHFSDEILVYQTITDVWSTFASSHLLALAGESIVTLKDEQGKTHWVIIGGEEKPGVRTAAVTDMEMDYTTHFGWINWTVLILYLVGMLALGYYFMRRESSSDDFFKGGGRIPWWAAGISIFATMLSAITYMSIPAKAYATDWTYYPMQICILLVSFPVIKYYLPFFRRLNVTTAYEYLERRFNYLTRVMASVLFIVFMIARMALVLFLPSLAMSAVTGINIFACIVMMAIVTIIYCTMGGMEAVVWGDVVQGIILVGGAFLAAGYLIFNTGGGVSDFFHIAADNDKFRLFDWSFDYRNATFWVVILGGLANNLISYTSDQTVIQRYLTTKDEKSAAHGILTNGLMSVFVTIAFFAIGTGLYTFFKTHPDMMDLTMAKNDAIFPFFMMSQLPAGIAGLLIAAIFAATMSTISSNINSVSTAFTVDIWKRLRPNINDKGIVYTARITGIVSGIIGMVIAILMATVNIQSLLDYFNTILGLLSGGIGGLFLMGIFFPRISAGNALAGFVCGTTVVFLMNFYTDVNFLLFGFVSIAVSVIVGLLLSFVRPNKKGLKGLTWKTLKH